MYFYACLVECHVHKLGKYQHQFKRQLNNILCNLCVYYFLSSTYIYLQCFNNNNKYIYVCKKRVELSRCTNNIVSATKKKILHTSFLFFIHIIYKFFIYFSSSFICMCTCILYIRNFFNILPLEIIVG